MKPRTVIAIACAVVAVVALIFLSVTVTATAAGGRTVSCGTGFTTDMSRAVSDSNVNSLAGSDASYSGFQAACDSALSARRGFGWGALGLAVLVGAGALAVRRSAPAGPPPAAAA
ncbi:hypothetical protein GCM10027258_62160 [Amycolatopsis stemonae]